MAKIHAMGASEVKIVGVSADFGGREAFMQAGADVFVPSEAWDSRGYARGGH